MVCNNFIFLFQSFNIFNLLCYVCGMVKSKFRVSNFRGQKSRCFLIFKYGEGYFDVSIQIIVNKKVDVSIDKNFDIEGLIQDLNVFKWYFVYFNMYYN